MTWLEPRIWCLAAHYITHCAIFSEISTNCVSLAADTTNDLTEYSQVKKHCNNTPLKYDYLLDNKDVTGEDS